MTYCSINVATLCTQYYSSCLLFPQVEAA